MKLKGSRWGMAGALTVAIAMLTGTTAYAVTHEFTNADGDQDYHNINNWLEGGLATTNFAGPGDVALFNLDGTNTCVITSNVPASGNMNAFQVGYAGGTTGAVHQTGGTVTTTSATSGQSRFGWNGGVGTYTLDGGSCNFNALRMGAGGSTGTMIVNGGELVLHRSPNGLSLHVGIGGDGIFEISGGAFRTRNRVMINNSGGCIFRVIGAGATQIGVGSHGTLDGYWEQRTDGTLELQIATNGITPILIDDRGDVGHANDGIAEFALDSLLDVSFIGSPETNAWLVMEAEGGIINNGLKFAAGVDTNLWSLEVLDYPLSDTDILVVSYGGAEYPLPAIVTNLCATGVLPMSGVWDFWDPEGNSSLSGTSASGFSTTFAQVITDPPLGYQPVVSSLFSSDVDLSDVGSKVTVSFDVVLGTTVAGTSGADFRMALFDTNLNSQIWSGFDFGPVVGSTLTYRQLPSLSATDTNNFVPGDFGLIGLGYDSLGSGAGEYTGSGLSTAGDVMHFEISLSRTDTDEVTFSSFIYDYTGGAGTTGTFAYVINELAPPHSGEWMPPGGKWDSINGFGINIFDPDPFSPLTSGSFVVSNLSVSTVISLPSGFGFNISAVTVDPLGDVTLTLTNPVIGGTYTVRAKDDLSSVTWNEVGSYVAEAPGTITVPAVDAAPYVNTNGFFDASIEVIEKLGIDE